MGDELRENQTQLAGKEPWKLCDINKQFGRSKNPYFTRVSAFLNMSTIRQTII